MVPRLLEKYRKEIIADLMQKFSLKNKLQVPHLEKIVVNMGVGEGAREIKVLEVAAAELAQIAGQRPVITRARRAISDFKIREGSPVGCKVTLRGVRMYEFLDRLINTALPRIKDFRGFAAASIDAFGNLSLGLSEQTIFPEIDIDKVQRLQGMDVTIVTTAHNKDMAFELLKSFGFPFR